MDKLQKIVYDDFDSLTLKNRIDLADELIDMYVSMVGQALNLRIWQSGSLLYNEFSCYVDMDQKIQVLSNKEILKSIQECPSCGKKYDNFILEWTIDDVKNAIKRIKNKETKDDEE